jgi:uncharacterized protein with NRDE domain
MCVSALAIGVSPHWPLLIAGNRDEFLTRPTQQLGTWRSPAGHAWWGGQDQSDGGTWLAITPQGTACALVTNIRQGQPGRGIRSRGHLPLLWIDAVASSQESSFFETLQAGDYGAFNLICGQPDLGRWWYFNNVDADAPTALTAGVYGLSNARLNSPWPKSERLSQSLGQVLPTAPSWEAVVSSLHPHLIDPTPAPSEHLPDTGVGLQAEQVLSSVFIDWPERQYGTRSSHVVALTPDSKPRFWEATYANQPMPNRNHPVSRQSLL